MTNLARGKAIGYAVVLFVAGGICGAFVVQRFAPPPQPQTLKIGRVDEISAKITAKLQTGLGLTPDQLKQISPLITQASQELEDSHRDCLRRIEDAINHLHASIAKLLTDDQKPKLKELDADRAATMRVKYNYQPATAGATN